MAGLQEIATVPAGARAAGLDEERYRFLRTTTFPLQSRRSHPPSSRAWTRPGCRRRCRSPSSVVGYFPDFDARFAVPESSAAAARLTASALSMG